MPEGPEIWILSEAINKHFNTNKTIAYGKHLFFIENGENWSFGLTGKINLVNNELTKLNVGWINGEKTFFSDYNSEIQKLGINWLSSSEEDLNTEIGSWKKSKKKLAGLLLDQSKISGIGVAWGSEILYKAKLNPNIKACEQNLDNLVNCLIEVREKIKMAYKEHLDNSISENFINEWFDNLYKIRKMDIYKKGSKIEVLGRTWWV